VEIPGTKLGLQTVVEVTRAIFGVYPKHVSGDIVVPANAQSKATVTFYVTKGRERSPGISIVVPPADIGLLAQLTAEKVLRQVNPYVLGAYRRGRGEFVEACSIAQQMAEDPSQDRLHTVAAFNLWASVLYGQERFDEAAARYQKAIELDPKYAFAYYNWGRLLSDQKKYDDAVAKYRKVTELDPKDPDAHNGWGNALYPQGRYDEAIAKYRMATDLDPKNPAAYFNWANALAEQKQYDKAIAKYQKATELDPNYALAYINWGTVLRSQGKLAETEEKLAKARELGFPQAGVQ